MAGGGDDFVPGGSLAPEEPRFRDVLDTWADGVAAAAERAGLGPDGKLDRLARAFDDRRHPPTVAGDVGAGAGLEPLPGFDADHERDPNERPGTARGTRAGAPLGSIREVISTSRRYLDAAARCDDAYGVREAKLQQAIEAAGAEWSAAAVVRRGKLEAALQGLQRRRAAMQHCVQGQVAIPRWRCKCCGGLTHGAPMTCNNRHCPRCAPKLRRQAQAKIIDVLELVDRRLHHDAGAAWPCRVCDLEEQADAGGRRRPLCAHRARWRLLTLTVPSWSAFLPMRRFLGRCWSNLLRSQSVGMRRTIKNTRADGSVTTRDVGKIGAAVACWETTHTRAGWHVHVHALVDAFLPFQQVRKVWQSIALREFLRDAPFELSSYVRRTLEVALQLRKDAPASQAYDDGQLLELPAFVDKVVFYDGVEGEGGRGPFAAAVAEIRTARTSAGGRERFSRAGWLGAEVGPTGSLRAVGQQEGSPAVAAVFDLARNLEGAKSAGLEPVAVEQLLRALLLMPEGVGVDLRATGGTRQQMVFELAKYLAKDLAGAQTPDDASDELQQWGVAGTPERLAEFMAGTFRWRSLRTYGLAFRAAGDAERLQQAQQCDSCGSVDLEWDGRTWLDDHEAAEMQAQRPRAPPAGVGT